jgi:hypothetical protein
MEPRYTHIEFCRNPKTLWEKVKSGKWEWLGVHKDGKFVLGSGKRAREGGGSAVLQAEGAEQGVHGWRATATGVGLRQGGRWYQNEAEARAAFESAMEAYEGLEGSFLAKAELIINREIVEQRFVVVHGGSTYR